MKTTTIQLTSSFKGVLGVGLVVFSFVVPFFLGGHQLINGTLVNAAIFISSSLSLATIWPVIFLPSLATLGRGLLFGLFTPFLVYFLPFIWLGNFVLIMVFKKIRTKRGDLIGVTVAAMSKSFLLFSLANFFFHFNLVPRLFLQTMGVNQLITALLGGFSALWIIKRLK